MPGWEKVNGKVVRVPVRPDRPVLARRGAMLAYTGAVAFSPVAGGGGVGGFLGRSVAGEQTPMMLAQGQGEVLYGYRGLHHAVIELDGTQLLAVESDRLLVHDGSLSPAVTFLGDQGGVRGAVRGAVTGQGLFTTQLSGVGSVAVLAHGGLFRLPVTPGSAVAVDPQAFVATLGPVQVELKASVGLRDVVGRGSGEALQLRLSGTGAVWVQASERKVR